MSTLARISFRGHLTKAALHQEIESLPNQPQGGLLLVDCSAMTGYDPDARDLFVEWNQRLGLRRVAVVTSKPLWRVVIAAMSLASRTEMRAFSEPPDAEKWLRASSS